MELWLIHIQDTSGLVQTIAFPLPAWIEPLLLPLLNAKHQAAI